MTNHNPHQWESFRMTDPFETEAALGKLINLSGKMRMLSHRAVMAALQAALISEETNATVDIFEAALSEFQDIAAAVRSGSEKLGIPAQIGATLEKTGAQRPEIQEPISRFLTEANGIREQFHGSEFQTIALARFSDFVAHDLLTALNALNNCVTAALQGQLAEQRKAEETARGAAMAAVRSIGEVSMKVKLISLNATVEAARAGEHGRGFAVIAQEIRALSETAAASTHQISSHLQRMA